jgi:hypothetical protein
VASAARHRFRTPEGSQIVVSRRPRKSSVAAALCRSSPRPAAGSYILQQYNNVAAPAGWTTSSYSINPTNGINSITITAPTGNLFFRLKQ